MIRYWTLVPPGYVGPFSTLEEALKHGQQVLIADPTKPTTFVRD